MTCESSPAADRPWAQYWPNEALFTPPHLPPQAMPVPTDSERAFKINGGRSENQTAGIIMPLC